MKEHLELNGGVEISKSIEHKIKRVGVTGLDFQKAKDLGFFERISHLLSLVYATNMAAYMIFGEIDYMLSSINGRKHEIAKTLGRYEKAVDHLVSFFTDYYNGKDARKDMSMDTENLYRNLMKWANLPMRWELGDGQFVEDADDDLSIRIVKGEDEYRFYKSLMDVENIEEPKESWCVTQYDLREKTQKTVHTDMDKASAMMVGKRCSAVDKDNIYTASLMRDIVEKRTEVTPFKVFKGGETIGKVIKTSK